MPAKKSTATIERPPKKTVVVKGMSASHKAALAEGRNQARAVKSYLDALESHKPKRGRKRTPESIQRRLDAIDEQLGSSESMKRLALLQEQLDLQRELEHMGDGVDMEAIETDFVQYAAAYSEAKGITYNAWRAFGVQPEVLKRAGISRAGS